MTTAAEYLTYLISSQEAFTRGELTFGVQVAELQHLQLMLALENNIVR